MRHAIAGKKMGRRGSWRKATVRDIAKATLIRQRICTTKTKAKEARKLVDQLITLGKKGTLAHKRRAFAILCDHKLVSALFKKTAPRFTSRNGGYTRIIPLSLRRGDNAQLAYLELTEKEEVILSKPKSRATSKTKDLKDVPEKKKESTPKTPGTAEPEPKAPKKDAFTKKEKPKPGKSFTGGIRKMFRRKQTD